MAESAARLLKRWEQLVNDQQTARTTWQDIGDYVVPWKSNIQRTRTEGEKQTEFLFDATAIHAMQLLASSLHGTMTPATQPWLSLKMRQEELNEIKAVQDWLEDCARRMHRALRQSNFNTSVHEMYIDLASFGTGCLMIEERPLGAQGRFAGFRFTVPAVGTYAIGEDADGRVDTLFRVFKLALRAAYAKWGDRIGSKLVERMAQRPDELTEFLHAVYPRQDRAYGPTGPKRGATNMAWASCYVALEPKLKVDEGGFEEWMAPTPRWAKTSGEIYGRGPSHTALPDVKSLNAAKKFILEAAPLAMAPPSVERDDSVVGEFDRRPAGRIVVSGAGPLADQVVFLDTKTRADMSQLILNEERAGIRLMYFTDQLLLHEKPQMTATEVMARQEQMYRLLGPTTGRLESEFLNPLVQRCFAIMSRAHAFLPLPNELRELVASGEADLDVEYEGPLARAQRTVELTAQDRVLNWVVAAVTAKQQFPDPLWDVLDLDKQVRDRAVITGLSSDSLRSEQDVASKREQDAKAKQIQGQVALAGQMAEGAGKAAPMLKAMTEMGQTPGASPNGKVAA